MKDFDPKAFDPTTIPSSSSSCPFCTIVQTYPPYPPSTPPSPSSPILSPLKLTPSSFIILSTPLLIAFLDIMPLSPGHILLCPRSHTQKLSDVSSHEASELGLWLRLLSKALSRTTGVYDWNVVQNNGAAAAQVVDHVHYHLIPRPEIRAKGKFSESFTMFGRGQREDLDDDEAGEMAAKLRENIADVLDEDARRGKL
ncbi:HIT domain-containing protein [Astrocystis sublimbata]|nr:HIT domain-containing protein [Astrocystis sublimbata]